MIVRNGIKTTLRAKARTWLFSLLILVLTLALTLGTGMWVYCAELISRFDENYTSIVLAEYMGDDYPDADAPDARAREAFSTLDDEAIASVDGVKLWERTQSSLVCPDGYKRFGVNHVPYSSYGVIVISNLHVMEDGGYSSRIIKSLYTREGKENIFCLLDTGGSDFSFSGNSDKMYLLHGQFVDRSSNRTFMITDFYEGCETKPWLELSGKDDPALKDSLFAQRAEYYRFANNTAMAVASNDIAALELFQQNTLYLEDGRFPLANEKGVCLLSGSTAESMGIGVGDTIDVSVLASKEYDRFDVTGTGDERTLEVVGVTNKMADYTGYIWVSNAEGDFSSPFFGYELGRAVLQNALAVQAVAQLEQLMPDQVRLTLYDQGYSAAVQPIQALRSTAMAMTGATVLGALAVLFLFAYLFVGRQKETVQVMVSLGTPKGKIRRWLLSGAALIAFLASAVGTVLGYFSLNSVIAYALSVAERLYAADTRYSNATLGLVKSAPEGIGISVWYSVLAGVAVFVFALLLCLIFVRQAKKENTPKKGKTSVRLPKGKTSTFGRGSMRFAMLSAKRGGWRSGIVPATVLVLTMLIGMLATGASGWSGQLNDLYDNSKLEGQVVSFSGRSAAGLDISAFTARKLWKSGLLSDISVSIHWNYWTEMPVFGDNAFGAEAMAGWIIRQPVLAAANSLNAIPEFYYTDRPEIQWLEGWDETFLADTEMTSILEALNGVEIKEPSFSFTQTVTEDENGNVIIEMGTDETEVDENWWMPTYPTYPVLAANAFLEANDLKLGDETIVSLEMNTPGMYYGSTSTMMLSLPIKIVGSFQQTGQKANLYTALGFWCTPDWITGETDIMEEGERLPDGFVRPEDREKNYYWNTTFRTCRFTLNSAYDLEAFRGFLKENHFSQVGKMGSNRTTVLLLDQEFTETVSGLRRYITFGSILFPVLLIAVALLGFIISWLMINSRRMEFAILRGIGGTKRRAFATFFLEQATLCILGCAAGAAILTVFDPAPVIWFAAAGFLVCYLAGTALSILAVGRTKLMELLSERE